MSNYKEKIAELLKLTSFPNNPKNCVYDLFSNKKIILYGAGDGFITFSVFVLRRYGFKAYAVLDCKFKSGGTFSGIPAFSPLEYTPTNDEKENAIVVVTVGRKEYHEEIFNCLRSLGFKNVILSTDIYEYHIPYPSTELESEGFNYYLENKKQIMDCLDLFSDDLSCDIFTRCIQTHMLRKLIHIPYHSPKEQYFPRDINLSKGYSRFINCGAYNGDTIKQLITLHGKVAAIACFEPDIDNFKLLTEYLCENQNKIAKSIIAFPCGVFNEEKQLYFESGNKWNSMTSHKGDSIIQCVSIDHVIPRFKPTFINMDIEGAELEALKGAELLIKKNKPDLAVCVYHAPNHMWDIPLYIQSLDLGYKFYLRNYTSLIGETVLYATI